MRKRTGLLSGRFWMVIAGVVSLLPAGLGLASVTAASTGIQETSVLGEWTLAADWGCDGTYSTVVMVISTNDAWSDNAGNTGTWFMTAGMLTFKVKTSSTMYSGVVASKSVTGIQANFDTRSTGCFYMLKADLPGIATARDDSADVTGNPIKAAANGKAGPPGIRAPQVGVQAVPGDWTLGYDWNCDGTYGSGTLTLNQDGTFVNDTAKTGVWFVIGGMLIFKYDGLNTTYGGILASEAVTGIAASFSITRGLGCFYMRKATLPTVVTAQADSADEVGNPIGS